MKINGWMIAIAAFLVGVVVGPRIAVLLSNDVNKQLGYCIDPTKVAELTLTALKRQNKLTVLEADINGTTTAKVDGIIDLLDATKTLQASGKMLYQIDFEGVDASSLRWDRANKTLAIEVPPPITFGPIIDLTSIRETKDGKIVMFMSDAEKKLDVETRQTLKNALRKVADSDKGLQSKAREAARAAIVRDFTLPLEAVGVTDAKVEVRFTGDKF
jgi:hypothetical protein